MINLNSSLNILCLVSSEFISLVDTFVVRYKENDVYMRCY